MRKRESESGSEMARQRKRETSEKEMASVVTMSGRCGKRKLLNVGSETREANGSKEGEDNTLKLSGEATKKEPLV